MTIKIGKIGSHGKARILSYGHDYEIQVPTIRDGFRKSEYHWDGKLGLVHEPYPLSPEEQTEADKKTINETFKIQIPDLVKELQIKLANFEVEINLLNERIKTLESKS